MLPDTQAEMKQLHPKVEQKTFPNIATRGNRNRSGNVWGLM
jgi:hypothetical protein